MDPVQLHLMLNKILLFGIVFVILFFIISYYLKNNLMLNISLIMVIMIALWAIATHQSGEVAEEFVKTLPVYPEKLVQDHDIAADVAFIFIVVVGVFAILCLLARRYHKELVHFITTITLVLLIIGGLLLARAAYMGFKIHNPEFFQSFFIIR